MLRALVCGAVAVAASACAPSLDAVAVTGDVTAEAGEPPVTTSSGPGFWSGERLSYEIHSHGITVGEIELEAQLPCAAAGRAVVPVESSAERVGIVQAFAPQRGELLSWLDVHDGHPLRSRLIIDSTKQLSDSSLKFGRGGYRYYWRRTPKDPTKKKPPKARSILGPPNETIHDIHSTVGLLRNWDAKIGAHALLYTVVKRQLWQVEVTAAAQESLSIGGSSFDTMRIEAVGRKLYKKLRPSKKPRRFAVWISQDEHRIPVKAWVETRKVGVVEIELAHYEQRELGWPERLSPCAAQR